MFFCFLSAVFILLEISSKSKTRNIYGVRIQCCDGNYIFDVVKEQFYPGFAVTSRNDLRMEIKQRITLQNSCHYGLSRHLSSRDLFRATKLLLYKSLVLPVFLYIKEKFYARPFSKC